MVNHLGNWRNGELGNFITLKRGFDLPQQKREDGQVPIFSSSGITGTHSTAMVNAPGVITGRYGTIGEVFYAAEDFWPLNTTLFVEDFHGNDAKFIYYFLKTLEWSKFTSASAVPGINRNTVHKETVSLPDIETQRRIASTLSMLDEKIKTNTEINDNLQQQAAALFESWFVNYDPWDGVQPSEWENAPLGSFVEIKRGGSPRPIQDFLSDSGLRWLKISDVTSLSSPFVLEIKEHIKEEGLRKTVFLHAGELVLSNSATPGIPKILDVDTCIHDGWLYFPKSELSKYYLYLFFKHIRKELVALGNGSVFTNLKTDILKAFPATKADESTLKEFDALVTPLFDAMLNADRENFKLAAMRDALLPKLMSGEIDVSAIQL